MFVYVVGDENQSAKLCSAKTANHKQKSRKLKSFFKDEEEDGKDSGLDSESLVSNDSFGKRTPGCPARRSSECLILEPSEMIVIDYPDVQALRHAHRTQYSSVNVDRLLTVDNQEDVRMRKVNNEAVMDQVHPDIPPIHTLISKGDHYLHNDFYKRSSHASDTSSAYSGSDLMLSSIDDQENADIDLSRLVESVVDSDDEEGYAESTDSRDNIRECLEKDPSERTEDDIEILLEFMQHFQAFANMTLATRRALCAVMVFAMVDKAGTIVMRDGEELDSWSILLNGEVEIIRPDGTGENLTMGDCFGVSPSMEKVYHCGEMRTLMDECQFVCIAQKDYCNILNQGEANTQRHEEEGHIVMVTEHRILDGGSRRGYVVIRGKPERLMLHLLEDHSSVDPNYIEDFLLTYRTFLESPVQIADKLLDWFENVSLRQKVTRIVLIWVNSHFNDFETDTPMSEFLEQFENLLEREKMRDQLRTLNYACAAKARSRTITLTRSTKEEILHFKVLGGLERNCGIFISKVERNSKAYEAGLKRGDQILEVNGQNFQAISHNRALEILRGTTHLSIMVRSNLLDFKEMVQTQDTSPRSQGGSPSASSKHRLSVPDLDLLISPHLLIPKEEKCKKKGFMTLSNKPGIRRALKKMNFLSKTTSDDSMNHSDENLYMHHSRKSSTSSSASSSTTGLSNHLSASNPDISTCADDSKWEFPEHVVKVYRADQSFKFLLIHKETTAREVVMLALREFGVTDPSSNYSLCEVTVECDGLIKQKRLPDQLQGLPDRQNLNGRYYLKNNMNTETLVPDELMPDLVKESQISLMQLNTAEVASQLTLSDFKVFKEIESTEYVDDLFKVQSKYGCPNLRKFEELVNKEMFWVVTEVVSEKNLVKRIKLIKHFIKIARHCKDCKNFNSMFAIVSGLGNGAVSRLRNTWEKLPTKYIKMFEELMELMNPTRNMAKYRNLINNDHIQPPVLPFFPIAKKDLTFIDLGNDSIVDGLVNFEKLRMIAKEVRHLCNLRSARYDVSTMFLGTPSMYASATVSGVATLKRTKNRRGSVMPNAKKMFDEAQMVRRVKSYLSNMSVVTDEEKLTELSYQCEPPPRKRDTSPNISVSTTNLADKPIISGPKFGSTSPQAVQKLMALTDKVRPHNSKHPLPPTSPVSNRRQPASPRQSKQLSVLLSPESSSIVSLSNLTKHKPSRTASIGSSDSASPSSCSYHHPYETDSGHGSLTSSNFDSHSASSTGSSNSPPIHRTPKCAPQSVAATNSLQTPPPPSQPQVRPPLPPYHVVMQNAPAQSHYIHQTYTNSRRPPLPDYHAAAQMALISRQKQMWQMARAHSHDDVLGYAACHGSGSHKEEVDEEQVSAV